VPTLEIHLLGDFNFTYETAHVEILDSARLQSLLVYLLLHRQAPQSRQHLAFLLWPDTSERQAQSNLRNLLHRLRTAFVDIERFLHIDTRTLRWRDDAVFSLDVADFEAVAGEIAKNAFHNVGFFAGTIEELMQGMQQ
jgi:DNA-binding SARP family transcriptional activator